VGSVALAALTCLSPAFCQEAAKPAAQDPCSDSQAQAECGEPPFDFAKVPPVRPTPRLGYFLVAPTGPGYYSFLDWLLDNRPDQPPVMPYGYFPLNTTPFFDIDFRYLDKPDNTQHDFWDPLKRIHVGDNWLLSIGGQTWFRYMNEVDFQLTERNNVHGLFRERLYSDLWYRDQFRFFIEYLYADSVWQDIDPILIDINRSDFQNLFVELKTFNVGDKPVYVRAGRQEMLFGSQRLISTLDWANTRRTFQGVRAYRVDEKFDVDAFWVQPVIPNRNNLDSVDNNINFAGVWSTYKPKKGTTLDGYYLFFDNTSPVAVGNNGIRQGITAHTLGSRLAGKYKELLFDFESMLQLGDYANQTLIAGAATAGLGCQFADTPTNPQFWVYYDWASGENHPEMGNTRSTFRQLFPFGHYYFGYLDLVGRQNIHDVSCQAACFPSPWITAIAQFHRFWLAEPADALYNAAGAPIRNDPTGRSGRDVGMELDLLLSLHLSAHTDVLLGWSKLFHGNFIAKTGPSVSPELFYMQIGYRW
jgi:hypothetical protein